MINKIFLIVLTLARALTSKFLLVRGDWLKFLILPMLGILSISALSIFFYQNQKGNEENRVRAETRKKVEQASISYALMTQRSLRGIDALMQYLEGDFKNRVRIQARDIAQSDRLPGANPYEFVAIFDADGVQQFAAPASPNVSSMRGNKDFQFHAANSTNSLRIGMQIDAPIGSKKIIPVTKRINHQDGSFAGVILVAVNEDFFAFDANMLNGAALLGGLIGSDRRLIPFGRSTDNGGGEREYDRSEAICKFSTTTTSLPATCLETKKGRYFAIASINSFPYKVVVGVSEADVISAYFDGKALRHQALLEYFFLIGIFSFFIILVAIRFSLKNAEASNIRLAYRVATENGKDGFYLWKRILSPTGAIVEFMIVDCNEYGAALYKMTRSEILGKTVSDIYGNTRYTKFIIGYGIRMHEDGEGEIEYEIPRERSLIQASWIQFKYAKTYEGVAVTIRDISEKKVNEIQLDRLANYDTLTAVPNRHWMTKSLPIILEQAKAVDSSVALFFIDLDDFKDINDSLGHAAGDNVLRGVAQRLSEVIREEDHVIRLGGDEFTVIVTNACDREYLVRVATRIVNAFKTPFSIGDSRKFISASVGIARYPDDGADAETLIQKADMAMYAAKAQKGQYLFFDEDLLRRRGNLIQLEDELKQAVINNEFVIYYQPRIASASASGDVVGFEALVRWVSPRRGFVLPLEFIPLAENSELIILVGAIVIEKVAQQLRHWLDDGLIAVPVSINVSAKQFNATNIPGVIASFITRESIPASLIEVEITELVMLASEEEVLRQLSNLSSMGIRTHLDDFGTGYSSLSMLRRLPMDMLKIDRAFTRELGTSKESEILYRTMISMAHALGMKVVAEGVENRQQMDILRALDCDELQGFLFSKPLSASEAALLLENRLSFEKEFSEV